MNKETGTIEELFPLPTGRSLLKVLIKEMGPKHKKILAFFREKYKGNKEVEGYIEKLEELEEEVQVYEDIS